MREKDTPDDMHGKRLNWQQACAVLGCGKTRFYQLVKAGALPAFRLAYAKRGLWVYQKDCEKLLASMSYENGA